MKGEALMVGRGAIPRGTGCISYHNTWFNFVSIVDDNWEPPPMLQPRNVSATESTEGMYYL